MAKISIETIKKLREETGAGVMDVKRALEETKGNQAKAIDLIRKKGLLKAEKRKDKEAKEGIIATYVHQTGKMAALVELLCETDFVAKTEDFVKLGKELAMQVASMDPKSVKELITQPYIRDPKMMV